MKKIRKTLLVCALALGATTLTGCGVEQIVGAVGGGGGGGGFNLGSITKLLGGALKFPNIGIGSIGNIGNGNTVNVGGGSTGNTSITDSTVGGYPAGTVESSPLDPIPTDDGSVPVADNGGGSAPQPIGSNPIWNEGEPEPFVPQPYEPQDGSEA